MRQVHQNIFWQYVKMEQTIGFISSSDNRKILNHLYFNLKYKKRTITHLSLCKNTVHSMLDNNNKQFNKGNEYH